MMPFRCQVAADFGLAAQTMLVLAHGYLCYAGRAVKAWMLSGRPSHCAVQ